MTRIDYARGLALLALILAPAMTASAGAQLLPIRIDPEPWYDANWSNRVSVTVQSTQVDSALTDFPVYVDLSGLPAGFHSTVRSDGGDIRVTGADGTTEVARELVFYDSTNDAGELHLAGDLSSSSDTRFFIYYGNAAATDYATTATFGAEAVWDASFAAVWHLQEDPSGTAPQIIDSTSNSQDGTSSGVMLTEDSIAAGQLSGRAVNFDGIDDVIRKASFLLTAYPVTICAWHRPETYTATDAGVATLADTAAGNDHLMLAMRDSDDASRALSVNPGTNSVGADLGTVTLNTWQRSCAVFVSDTSRKISWETRLRCQTPRQSS